MSVYTCIHNSLTKATQCNHIPGHSEFIISHTFLDALWPSPEVVRNFKRTVMRRITTLRSTTDRIYDDAPLRLLYYNTYHCVTIVYSIQYSNMLYRFVA